jgi:ribosomal protein L24
MFKVGVFLFAHHITHCIVGTTTEYISAHLRRKGFPVIVSPWLAGQLYVVADCPKTIAESLPLSLYLAVKNYTFISDEERAVVERFQSELPHPAWLRIRSGEYRGDMAQTFEQSPNGLIEVLIVARRFPYTMPRGSRALIERSRLPNDTTVSDIIRDDAVVGWKYKGESYYMGLLLKAFHRDRLEHIASPHIDDIRLHLESGWNKPFLQATLVTFSLQFLRVGDWARVLKGSLRGELGQVISTDHTFGTVGLESALDGRLKEIEISLQDVERVFRIGDPVRVVAGSYLGLQGHIIQMDGPTFQICQDGTNEQVNINYLCNLTFDGLKLGI